MIEYIENYSEALSFLSSLILVFVTIYYAYLTRKILKETSEQAKKSMNPVIGLKIDNIKIGKTFGKKRRNMGVDLTLTNVGNAPAIDVKVDANIELRYSSIDGDFIIPSRFEPDVIPFIQSNRSNNTISISFGNTLISHFLADVKESSRLNIHRINTNPSQEAFRTSKLTITIYYRNSLGQFYQTIYKTEIGIFSRIDENPIPKEDESCEITWYNIPRPIFQVEPVNEKIIIAQIEKMNKIRYKSGW